MTVLPVWRSVGTYASGTGDVTPGLPSGWRPGDIFLMPVEFDSTNTPTISIAGWTQTGTTIRTGASATRTGAALFWRRAEASEFAPTIADTGDHTSAIIHAFSGCALNGNPIHQHNESWNDSEGTSVSFAAVTTTINNCIVALIGTHGVDTASAQYTLSTSGNLASATERSDNSTTNGSGGGIGFFTGNLAVAGSSGSPTATLATTTARAHFTVALAPQADNEGYSISDSFNRDDQSPLTVSSSGHTWTKSLGSFDIGVINRKNKMTQGYILVDNYATPQLAANDASGKRLIFPVNKTYTVTDLLIPANCYVEGNGSILKYANNSTTSSSHSDSLLKVNGSGVTVDGLKFDGNSQNQTIWSQHRHCIRILGTFSNVEVKNCQMYNIIGDGTYVNTQTGSNINVHGNTYSANFDNRNGISVVTGTNVNVYQNTLSALSRSDMPGAIDIEPNVNTDTLSNVKVYQNTILQQGGTPGDTTEAGIIYTGFANAAANGVQIYENDISGARLTAGVVIAGINGGPFNAATNIDVYDNNIHDLGAFGGYNVGVELDWWIGADVYNNTISDTAYGIYNYQACLGTSTGNIFNNVTTAITNDTPHCS